MASEVSRELVDENSPMTKKELDKSKAKAAPPPPRHDRDFGRNLSKAYMSSNHAKDSSTSPEIDKKSGRNSPSKDFKQAAAAPKSPEIDESFRQKLSNIDSEEAKAAPTSSEIDRNSGEILPSKDSTQTEAAPTSPEINENSRQNLDSEDSKAAPEPPEYSGDSGQNLSNMDSQHAKAAPTPPEYNENFGTNSPNMDSKQAETALTPQENEENSGPNSSNMDYKQTKAYPTSPELNGDSARSASMVFVDYSEQNSPTMDYHHSNASSEIDEKSAFFASKEFVDSEQNKAAPTLTEPGGNSSLNASKAFKDSKPATAAPTPQENDRDSGPNASNMDSTREKAAPKWTELFGDSGLNASKAFMDYKQANAALTLHEYDRDSRPNSPNMDSKQAETSLTPQENEENSGPNESNMDSKHAEAAPTPQENEEISGPNASNMDCKQTKADPTLPELDGDSGRNASIAFVDYSGQNSPTMDFHHSNTSSEIDETSSFFASKEFIDSEQDKAAPTLPEPGGNSSSKAFKNSKPANTAPTPQENDRDSGPKVSNMDSKWAKAAPTWTEPFGDSVLNASKAVMDSKQANAALTLQGYDRDSGPNASSMDSTRTEATSTSPELSEKSGRNASMAFIDSKQAHAAPTQQKNEEDSVHNTSHINSIQDKASPTTPELLRDSGINASRAFIDSEQAQAAPTSQENDGDSASNASNVDSKQAKSVSTWPELFADSGLRASQAFMNSKEANSALTPQQNDDDFGPNASSIGSKQSEDAPMLPELLGDSGLTASKALMDSKHAHATPTPQENDEDSGSNTSNMDSKPAKATPTASELSGSKAFMDFEQTHAAPTPQKNYNDSVPSMGSKQAKDAPTLPELFADSGLNASKAFMDSKQVHDAASPQENDDDFGQDRSIVDSKSAKATPTAPELFGDSGLNASKAFTDSKSANFFPMPHENDSDSGKNASNVHSKQGNVSPTPQKNDGGSGPNALNMGSKQAKAPPKLPEFFGEFGLSISKAFIDSKHAEAAPTAPELDEYSRQIDSKAFIVSKRAEEESIPLFSSSRPFAGNRKKAFDVCSPDQAVLDEVDSLYPLLSNGFDENVAMGVNNPCYEGDDFNIDCERANAECDPLPSNIDMSLYSGNDSITSNVYDLVDFRRGEQVAVCIPVGAADERESQFIGDTYVDNSHSNDTNEFAEKASVKQIEAKIPVEAVDKESFQLSNGENPCSDDSDSGGSQPTASTLEAESALQFTSFPPSSRDAVTIELASLSPSESESGSIFSNNQQRIEERIKQMSRAERKALHVISSQKLILDILDLKEEDNSDESRSCCAEKCGLCLEMKAFACCLSKAKSCCKQVPVSKSFRESAKVGAQYALAIIKPPAKLTTLLVRLLQLAFFGLTVYVYANEASQKGFINSLQESKFTLVLFCLATVDLFLGVIMSAISVFLAARNTVRLKAYSKLGEDENPNPPDTQKSGWSAVYEFFSKIFAFVLIYPLLIGDIYEFALVWNAKNATLTIEALANLTNQSTPLNAPDFTTVLKNSALEDIPKSVVLGIGLLLTLFDIYLHRIHMMRENFNRIRKLQQKKESCCCSIISRLIAHSIFLMVFNILLLVAIGFKAVEENRLECLSIERCKSKGEFELIVKNGAAAYDGDPTVSNKAWFMIAAGMALPLLSIAIFIGTNVLWFQEYFVLLFRGVMNKDEKEECQKLPPDLEEYASKVKEKRGISEVAEMLDDRHYSSEFSCWNRFVKSFCDLRAIVLVIVYWCSVFAFLAFTFEMASIDEPLLTTRFAAIYLGLLILFLALINDIITLVLALSWTCLVFGGAVAVVYGIAATIIGYCLYCVFCSDKSKK